MPSRCIVGGCNNLPDLEKGIGLNLILFPDDNQPLARKRRKRWVDFVKLKQAKWEPTKTSAICFVHLKPDNFERKFTHNLG